MAPISFIPSILWIAISCWIATVGASLGYLILRKSRQTGLRIQIDSDSFLFKTFLVAASFVSIFSIGTGVQFLNPNAGIDQFLVIFVLVMWLKYSVVDLKQKLDSFVVSEGLPRTSQEAPRRKAKDILAPREPRRHANGILGAQELINSLKYFMTVWEQHGGSEIKVKWGPQYTADMYHLSRDLVGLDTRGSWGYDLEHQVRLTSNELRDLASAFQAGKYDEAIVHGGTAYRMANALMSFLESKTE